MKRLIVLLLLFAAVLLPGKEFTVDPANALIVISPKAGAVARLAARELQHYVKVMTGKTIPIAAKAVPGKYLFTFRKPSNVKLKAEEAVWETTGESTNFYGDSSPAHPRSSDYSLFLRAARTGDLTAVYDFLEQQLGFIFLAPGELGTSYTPAPLLKLAVKKNSIQAYYIM